MDLSRFMRTRLRLGVWLSLPLVLILGATIPSWMMKAVAERGLRQRQALLDAIPEQEVQARRAETLLESVTPASPQLASARDAVSRRLQDAAVDTALTIRSVKMEDALGQDGDFRTLRITAQIQGSLREVVQWLDRVQKPGLLLSVQTAQFSALGQPPDETFSAEIVLDLYLRAS